MLNMVLSSRVSRVGRVSAMVSVRFKYRVEHGTRIWDRRFKDCQESVTVISVSLVMFHWKNER